MKIKYNHVNLSKISLALIYSLLDMINSLEIATLRALTNRTYFSSS